jgi:hypothetical protein
MPKLVTNEQKLREEEGEPNVGNVKFDVFAGDIARCDPIEDPDEQLQRIIARETLLPFLLRMLSGRSVSPASLSTADFFERVGISIAGGKPRFTVKRGSALTVSIDSEKFSVWEEVRQRSSEQLTAAFTAVYKEATEAVQADLNPSPKKRRVGEEALSAVFQQKAIGYKASVSTLRAYIKECDSHGRNPRCGRRGRPAAGFEGEGSQSACGRVPALERDPSHARACATHFRWYGA